MRLLDSRDQVLRHKIVRLVKVLCNTEEWRRKHGNARTRCVPPILTCSRKEVRGLVMEYRRTVACAGDCMHMCV